VGGTRLQGDHENRRLRENRHGQKPQGQGGQVYGVRGGQVQRRAQVRRPVRGRPVRAVRAPVRRPDRPAVQPGQVNARRGIGFARAKDRTTARERPARCFILNTKFGFFFLVEKQK